MLKRQLGLFALIITSITYGQDFYNISNINTIELEFTDANWDATMDTYYANDLDERLVGTCTVNGVLYDSVGVKYKGNSSYSATNAKNPLNIKLNYVYNQDYQGYQVLKLSSGKNDPSFVREVLSYEIGRKYMDMPLSNYAVVYINGNYYGLFTSNESINGDFMERRFYCDDDNTRVKCNPASVMGGNGSSLMYLGTDTTAYYDYYEMMSDFGWTELMNLTNQIPNLSTIEAYLDVDRAIWMLAFNNMLVNLDSYTGPFRQNFYLIQDDNGRIMPIIWDLNESLGGFEMVNTGPPGPSLLTDLTELDPYLRETDNTFPLIYYLFSNATYRKMYLAHCRTILEENLSNGAYYTRGQELQAIIDAEVQNDPNGFYSYSDFITNLDNTTGTGPGGAFGIAEVIGGRVAYLASHTDFNFTTPTITSITNSPTIVAAYDNVTFTADIQNANYAYLGYRSYKADAFTKVEMFDDGLHGDGAASDGIWGTFVTLGATDLQYYIYAENVDAGMFSPVRAEHEFYDLTLSGGVVINEICAKNYAVAADQNGEYDDWIELYNNTGSTIDLSGYYLSDSLGFNLMWPFPSGTTIAANSYLIVWCDNDITQTGLHANFKLTSSGETLTLSNAAGIAINQVQYPKVGSNYTYGRYVNGTGGYIPMTATYNASNSYTAVGLEEESRPNVEVSIFPNPTTDFVNIQIDSDQSEVFYVYDLNGKLILSDIITNTTSVDFSLFEKGIYLVSIPELNVTRKVIVQ